MVKFYSKEKFLDYLFFDIEASEGESICSFGYVLTDTKFNIIEKNDILINPEAIFCTSARGKHKNGEKDRGITLAYPKETFLASPVYSEVYSRIKELVEKDDRLIVGFSHTNDVRYLCHANTRYLKPNFTYEFFDLQDVFRAEKGESNQISLERIINDFEINTDKLILHKSVDDAEMSMLAIKVFCEKNDCTLDDVIKKYPQFLGKTENGITTYNGVDSQKAELRKVRNICKNTVLSYARNVKINAESSNVLNGKKFCAGNRFEKEEFIYAMKLITVLAENGAKYVSAVSDADYFIKTNDDEGVKQDRLYFVLNNKNLNVKVISEEELLEMCNTTKEEVQSVSNSYINKLSHRLNKMIANLHKLKEKGTK